MVCSFLARDDRDVMERPPQDARDPLVDGSVLNHSGGASFCDLHTSDRIEVIEGRSAGCAER
jgi:hypothetical protein